MKYPVTKVLGAAAAMTVLSAGLAHADNINDSIEGSQSVSIATGGTGTASVKVVSSNGANDEEGCNIDPGETFMLSFAGPTGVTVPNLTVTQCDVFYPITISAASGAQSGTITATIATNTTGSGEFRNNVSIPVTITSGVVTPVNAAPTVATPAPDTSGAEGSELSTVGTFADDGGAGRLRVVQASGAGTVTQTAAQVTAGSWTWTHTPDDNFTGQNVSVKATDTQGAYVVDTFQWTSTNVAPDVRAFTPERGGACAVSVLANFTDPGTADIHTATIDWGDDSGAEDATVTATTGGGGGTVSGNHAYTAAGPYTVTVAVTDDEDDQGSNTAGFSAHNRPSAILQPINSSGTRSGFKIGSTIPVKITVTGCDGAAVSNLAPAVNLEKEDTTADVSVNEAVVTETPTNGKLMRWDSTGQQYIYNLSTKLSQFTGAQLTAGTWTVSVNDSSFARPVKAAFDLRK